MGRACQCADEPVVFCQCLVYLAAQQKAGAVSPGTGLLLALVCAIGIGSFLFHTFATAWAKIMDDLPILLFQLVYLWLYCRDVAGIRPVTLIDILLGYMLAAMMARQFPQVLNGSLIYAPALMVLLVLGVYHRASRRIEPDIILGAAGLFIMSLGLVDLSSPPLLWLKKRQSRREESSL